MLILGFIIGFIVGLLFWMFILLALIYFKHGIEQHITVIEKRISNVGPRPKGFIVSPETESERIRKAIIDHNTKQGRDTTIQELR